MEGGAFSPTLEALSAWEPRITMSGLMGPGIDGRSWERHYHVWQSAHTIDRNTGGQWELVVTEDSKKNDVG